MLLFYQEVEVVDFKFYLVSVSCFQSHLTLTLPSVLSKYALYTWKVFFFLSSLYWPIVLHCRELLDATEA